MAQNKIFIYGRHALSEALAHKSRSVRAVYFAREMDDKKLRALAREAGVPVEQLDPRKVTSWVERGAPHQGAVALMSLSGMLAPYDEWVKDVSFNKDTTLVLLNEVQDPHNVGTIIRSAAAFGASAVLMPQVRQSPVTGAVIKASAGMAFRLPLVSVTNVQQALSDLKKRGVRVYGLAGEGAHPLDAEAFDAPSLFIFGNESTGLPKAVRQLCDRMLSIPIEQRAESLNVAAAAAVTLFQWHTKRR